MDEINFWREIKMNGSNHQLDEIKNTVGRCNLSNIQTTTGTEGRMKSKGNEPQCQDKQKQNRYNSTEWVVWSHRSAWI